MLVPKISFDTSAWKVSTGDHRAYYFLQKMRTMRAHENIHSLSTTKFWIVVINKLILAGTMEVRSYSPMCLRRQIVLISIPQCSILCLYSIHCVANNKLFPAMMIYGQQVFFYMCTDTDTTLFPTETLTRVSWLGFRLTDALTFSQELVFFLLGQIWALISPSVPCWLKLSVDFNCLDLDMLLFGEMTSKKLF